MKYRIPISASEIQAAIDSGASVYMHIGNGHASLLGFNELLAAHQALRRRSRTVSDSRCYTHLARKLAVVLLGDE